VWFWTKPRVRVYTLAVTGEVIVSIAVTMLVLAGLIPDTRGLRIALSGGLVLLLITLLTRIAVDVIRATAAATEPAPSEQPTADDPETGGISMDIQQADKVPGD
jgi:hypothetical protein